MSSPKPADRHPELPTGRRWVTLTQAAKYYGVSYRTIREMVYDGRIPAYRLGQRFVRLDLNEIDALFMPIGMHAYDAQTA